MHQPSICGGHRSSTVTTLSNAGSYTVTVSLGGVPVQGSPAALVVQAGVSAADKTYMTRSSAASLHAGDTASVLLVLRDATGRRLTPQRPTQRARRLAQRHGLVLAPLLARLLHPTGEAHGVHC